MLFKKIIAILLCLGFLLSINVFNIFYASASEMIVGIDFEESGDCDFYGTDLSLFSSEYKDVGRSAGFKAKNGSLIEAYFDTSIGSQYADSQAIVFWLKTPEYANPSGDLANFNIGLICGDTRWKLNQNPTAGMAITYIWSSNNQVQNVPLVSQGGVFLDAPSDFEGFVIVPLNVLQKDWGTATTIDLPNLTAFNIVWEWIPTADLNKMYYLDSVGFTKDANKYLISLGVPFEKNKPMVTGIDFEKSSDYNLFNIDSSSFSTTYKDLGRSISFPAKAGSQMEAYFDLNVVPQYKDSEAIVFWLKAPTYANPSGDLVNLNFGFICEASTRWKLNQNPTAGMEITYIWSSNNQVQNVPLAYQGGVFLDVPSGFEGWVVIPLSTLVKAWGPLNTIDPTKVTALSVVYEWMPTADLNKIYYFDSVGFAKNIDVFLASILSPQTFDKYNISNNGANIITNVQPSTTVESFKIAFNPADNVSLSFLSSYGVPISDTEKIGTGSKIVITQNSVTTTYNVVIYGDVTGEGEIAINDLVAIKKHLLNQQILSSVYLTAGDIYKKSSVSISDVLAVKKYLLNIGTINQEPYKSLMPDYILNEEVWTTPTIDRNGFVFEVQALDYSPYVQSLVKSSIYNLKLGESKKIPCNAAAEEWENTFMFCEGGYGSPAPTTRQSALQMIQNFFNSYYIKGADHLWKALDGNFLNQHYAAEFGADILGAELGCDIKSYQMSIAYTRGAAKQYGKPWYMDYSDCVKTQK